MEQSRAGSVATVSSNRTRISLGINAIAFLVTTAAVVFLTWNVADEFAPVRGTMHSYEKSSHAGAYPHAYPTLDWIMSPAKSKSGTDKGASGEEATLGRVASP